MAQKALFAMHQRCADLCIKDLLTRCSLFSFWVQPVLPYGCEIWGIEYFIYMFTFDRCVQHLYKAHSA